MVDRRVTVTATMDASGMIQGAKQAETAVERVGRAGKRAANDTDAAAKTQEGAFKRMARSAQENERAWTTAGAAITAFGAVTVGALAASAKAAVDWESAFAGVRKTVNDSEAGYAALSEELREMARTLPAAHAEIAGVAEAAGQLGISREALTDFTKTMIDLGETTNLSADEAATSLARFANVMGTSHDEFDNLGSAIVGLGNSFATTEREIVDMSMRLAGAGRQAGLTEGDVLGLATALSSVGIESEAGGTAFSRVITEMGIAVDTSSGKLTTFAQVAGMSASQFSQAWKDDAGGAISSFIEGMGRIQESGESLEPVLDELGMTDIRIGDALRRSASAADLFSGAMAKGNEEYEANVALTNEAEQRYATTAAQLQVFKNNVIDAATSLGQAFLPALGALADVGSDAAKWLGALPEPMQKVAAWSGAAAGGTALLAGSFLLLAPRALETYTALQKLGVVTPGTTTAIRNMAGVLTGPWGIAIGAAVTVLGAYGIAHLEARDRIERHTEALKANQGAIAEANRDIVANQLINTGAADAAERLGIAQETLLEAALGNADAMQQVRDATKGAGDEVRGLVGTYGAASTSAQQAQGDINLINTVMGDQAGEIAKARDKWEQYQEMTEGVARSAESLAAETARLTAQAEAHAAATGQGADAMERRFIPAQERAIALGDEAAEAYAKWVEEMTALDAGFINTSEALQAVEAETRAWAEAQAEATDSAEDSWEDFVDKAGFSLGTFIEELERQVAAQEEWEANMLLLTGRLSEAAIKMLEDMGPAGAQAAAALVDATDAEIERFNGIAEQRGGEAGNAWANAYADALASPVFAAAMAKFGQDTAEEIARQIAAGEITVQQAIEEYDLQAWVNVGARTEDYEERVAEGLQMAADANAVIPIDGDSRPARERLSTLEEIVAASTPSITIRAADNLARGTHLGLVGDINNSGGTVGINANAWDAYSVLNGFLNSIPRSVSIALNAIPLMGAFPGFMSGGYTGDGSTTEVAGTVHGQEFVSTASTTSDPVNRAALEFMHSGRSIREWTPPVPTSGGGGGGRGNVSVSVPVQTYERADPNLIGAAVAWQVGGLP